MSLTGHVEHLRTLALLDSETTLLQLAIVGVLEELAEVIDELTGNEPPGLGSV
jgi:hypothetical protein